MDELRIEISDCLAPIESAVKNLIFLSDYLTSVESYKHIGIAMFNEVVALNTAFNNISSLVDDDC